MHPHGLRTRSELLAAGVPSSTITRKFTRVLPQIYCAGEPTTHARCHAITLWQPTALLSHRTAAWLYGWVDEPDTLDATVPIDVRVRAPAWVTVHRRTLPEQEMYEISGLPVVTRERTLIDCIAVMSPHDVARVVDERLATDVDPCALTALVERTPRRRGNARALTQLRRAATGFASEPERILDRALIAVGIRMLTNYRVGAYICDFVDERARVIVEVDGREFHIAPEVFSRDRRRQNRLVLDGWLVLRYSAFDVLANPAAVAAEIAAVVRRRRDAR